jgi:hypothetical protein
VAAPGPGAPAGSAVEVSLTGPVAAGVAWEAALEVRGRLIGGVAGRWVLAADRRRVFFVPAAELPYRSRFEVRVNGTLLVAPGQAPARDETYGFMTGDPPDADVQPVLKNLAVRLDAYDPATGRMGDLRLVGLKGKPFLEFGAVVKDFEGRDKALPDFAFLTVDPAATLMAPIDGVVAQIHHRADGHLALWMRPSRGSDWLVYLDHVKDILVAPGQQITAGQPVCKSHDGFFELNVMYDRGSASRAYAPFVHFDPALSAAAQARIWELMDKAEELTGNPDLYDQEAMRPFFAGCRVRDMEP